MITIYDFLCECSNEVFDTFLEAYLFGSVITSDTPNDIDILLVYDKQKMPYVPAGKNKIREILSLKFDCLPVHFTTFSMSELEQTGFLNKIPFKKIK